MAKKTKKSKTVLRLLKYVFTTYKLQFFIVLVAIIVSSIASVLGIQFIQRLIDNYIVPLIGNQNPDFTLLLQAILNMAVIYVVGIVATYVYNRLMINISQGILNRIRTEMFDHMQTLPIGYFDSHPHGETMSTYTNDVDALRECLSQSIPQVFAAIITMVTVLISMFTTNIYLTLVVVAMVIVMAFVARYLGGNSSRFFIKQQEDMSKVNGYIEEMIEGQKVVKVFCYENENMKKFDELNEDLCDSATSANIYANILMPCILNIGNLGYVLVAVIGGILSVNGILSIGSIAAFLQYVK